MTKEEAINLLNNLMGMVDDNHGSDYDEALKMAINLLRFSIEKACHNCAYYYSCELFRSSEGDTL